MSNQILAIDPGTYESAILRYNDGKIVEAGIHSNEECLRYLLDVEDLCDVAIEMIACYGMPTGKETFETCVWIGRFIQVLVPLPTTLVYRRDIKVYLCGSMKAKDGNVRQALIDKLGPVGTKKKPGPCYGMHTHLWAALAVAVFAAETKVEPPPA